MAKISYDTILIFYSCISATDLHDGADELALAFLTSVVEVMANDRADFAGGSGLERPELVGQDGWSCGVALVEHSRRRRRHVFLVLQSGNHRNLQTTVSLI